MKLEALRRRWSDYFRRPATSVPPKIEPVVDPNDISGPTHELDDLGNRILKQLKESGVLPPHAEVFVRHEREAARPGIKPPPDAGTNGWTWSQWCQEVGADIPGWAFCRFAHRIGPNDVGFVFGYVRGNFGVWQQPFDVCVTTDEGLDQRSMILTCITHLRTGMGVGIFADRFVAISAAELSEKVCPVWEGDNASWPAIWNDNIARTLYAWHGIGIRESVSAHAHDQHGNQFPIYGQDNESVMAGKPERLS